jgi:hypothetical protein
MLVDWPAEIEMVSGEATGCHRTGGVIAGTKGYGLYVSPNRVTLLVFGGPRPACAA